MIDRRIPVISTTALPGPQARPASCPRVPARQASPPVRHRRNPGRPGPTGGGYEQQPGPGRRKSAALRLPGAAAGNRQVLLSRRFYLK
ncbi:MAG: hypothetical protein WAW52_02125 [Methanothrix sp.]